MLVNFCTAQFQPLLQCFQMQLDGYQAQNLAKDFSQNNGFLADSLQRPPVDLYIRFPFNIDIKHIYLGRSIGHHRSTLIELCVNHHLIDANTSWVINPSNQANLRNVRQLPFHRIAQIFDEDENTQRIEIHDHDRDQSTSNTSNYRFSSNTHLINCSTIKITIKRTWRMSSCALKYLQIWGSLSSYIPVEFKTKLQQTLFPAPAKVVPPTDQTPTKDSEEMPSEFLDSLTADLMLIPMLLPSGYLIDRTTLEKCIAEDTRWCRAPRDPFTLKAFTEVTQPVVAQQLKTRIDQFLSEHQHDPTYRHYGRVLDARRPVPERNLSAPKRTLIDDDAPDNMFKFNFNVEDNGNNQTAEMNEAEQVTPLKQEFGYVDIDNLQSESVEDVEKSRQRFESFQSDLVPNVYEGGFKTWECSHDLVDYLKSMIDSFQDRTTVIELGCGSGLPGLELHRCQHFRVDFQDFNREVVEQTGKQLKKERGTYNNRMYFGDWGDLMNVIPCQYYDIILTSETIYNTGNYGKLVRLFDHALQPRGVIYLAAKVYYFGVQGGVRQFGEYLSKTGLFNTRVVRVIDANVKREILEITRTVR